MVKTEGVNMSLTSILAKGTERTEELKNILRNTCPSKKEFLTISGNKPFSSEYIGKVPYTLENSYYSSVIGTAFDYLSRAALAKYTTNNKQNAVKNLICERGLDALCKSTKKTIFNNPERELRKKYDNSFKSYSNYIFEKGYITENLIEGVCYFARLEHIVRSGMLPEMLGEGFLAGEHDEIKKELKNLIDVFHNNFIKKVVKKGSDVTYNPVFGFCAANVGGADADIFIDGFLIDIKTSKNRGYKWQDSAQIWGYYILHRICQNNQDPYGSLINKKIRKLGFYKARYGEIEYVDLKQVEEEKIEESIKKVQNYFDNMRNHSQEIEK